MMAGRFTPEMDKNTSNAYIENAQAYSDDWLAQPAPLDLYELLKKFFHAGRETADVGCGNGRDANWLSQNGFKVFGFDYSEELLKIASELYPHIQFSKARFPELSEIQTPFHNIVCETVIMHLALEHIPQALDSLKKILRKNGVLYLSWRVTEAQDIRHSDGRLYTAFTPELILQHFDRKNILHFEDKISASSNKRVCRLIWKNA